MDPLKKLQDEAAATANRIDEVRAIESDDATVVAQRDEELKGLLERADGLASKIEFEKAVQASAAKLRQKVEACVPAPSAPVEGRVDIRAVSAPKPKYFDTAENAYRSAKWIQATFLGNTEARQWCRDHGIESRTLVEAVNSSAGFTMVEEFSTNLIRLVEQYGVAARYMQREVMGTDTKLVPKRLTGVTAYWLGENTEITASDPSGTMVQLVAKKLGVGTKVSNESLSDANAVNIAEWLLQEFATAISYAQDNASFNGDGTSSHGGIWGVVPKIGNSAYAGSVVTASSATPTSWTLADFEKALGKLPRYVFERGNPAWFCHHNVYHSVMQVLALNAGGNTVDTISDNNGLRYRFLGLPVVPVVVMDSVVTSDTGKIKVLCGDLSLSSILGMRQDFSLRMTSERFIELDVTAWYGTGRYDVVHHSLGDTSNPGPVVALKTA